MIFLKIRKNHSAVPVNQSSIEFFIEERSEDYVVSRMPLSKGALNPFGTIHAGAMLWLAYVTATVLAIGNRQIGENGQGFPLAINLNANLLGHQHGGEVRAEVRFVECAHRSETRPIMRYYLN